MLHTSEFHGKTIQLQLFRNISVSALDIEIVRWQTCSFFWSTKLSMFFSITGHFPFDIFACIIFHYLGVFYHLSMLAVGFTVFAYMFVFKNPSTNPPHPTPTATPNTSSATTYHNSEYYCVIVIDCVTIFSSLHWSNVGAMLCSPAYDTVSHTHLPFLYVFSNVSEYGKPQWHLFTI